VEIEDGKNVQGGHSLAVQEGNESEPAGTESTLKGQILRKGLGEEKDFGKGKHKHNIGSSTGRNSKRPTNTSTLIKVNL